MKIPSIAPRLPSGPHDGCPEATYGGLMIWAFLLAAGGSMAAADLDEAYRMCAWPETLEHFAGDARREVKAILDARRRGCPAHNLARYMDVLIQLSQREGVDIRAGGVVTATWRTPPPAAIHDWFHFEADVVRRVLNQEHYRAVKARVAARQARAALERQANLAQGWLAEGEE